MKLSPDHLEGIQRLCKSFHVDKMYLFGSVLNDKFTSESDIDFVVRFKEIDLKEYFENYISFKEELKGLLGREVDLVEEQTLKNPILKESIDNSKKLIYG